MGPKPLTSVFCRHPVTLFKPKLCAVRTSRSVHYPPCMGIWQHMGWAWIQYSTVQYSTVQYSTVQYSTVQYSTVQYSTVQYSTVQYSTVQYSTVQYSTVQYSTVQYSTVQYSTVQYSTVQYSTVQYSTVQYSTVQYSVMNFEFLVVYWRFELLVCRFFSISYTCYSLFIQCRPKTCKYHMCIQHETNARFQMQNQMLTLSAIPPVRIVLTITPVFLPPTMPKPSPEPSLCSSTVSIWPHCAPSLGCRNDQYCKLGPNAAGDKIC